MYLLTGNKEECCGCTACQSVCPTNSISFHKDEEGFLYPQIDTETCIECHLCEKVCPNENTLLHNDENPTVAAAFQRDKGSRVKSSSGGVFAVIAEWVLRNGGVVYGASFDSNMQLNHCRVDNVKDLPKLKGSKYLQSNLTGIYKDVKDYLVNNKWVYFVGTGCQVAGLYCYLRKKYDKLITSDLVCHGVPSQELFNQHILYLEEKYKGKIVSYNFRDGKRWLVCESFDVKNKNGKTKTHSSSNYQLSPYLFSFMQGFVFRPSCYSCTFASIPRQGDITLADYWGIKEKYPEIDSSCGVSLVLINSETGTKVWDKVSPDLNWYISDVGDASRYNQNLVRSSSKPTIRKTIFKEINEKGYKAVAETSFRPKYYALVQITSFVREILKTFRK